MRVKKFKGNVYGADLTANERKAMNMEIQRQIDAYNQNNVDEIDAMILWHLHEEFGFGKKRLLRFYETFGSKMKELSDQYLMEESKMPQLYQYKLKEYGIDVKQLNKRED